MRSMVSFFFLYIFVIHTSPFLLISSTIMGRHETTTTTPSSGQVHVEAVQTVTPAKVTGPRSAKEITTSGPLGKEALQSRMRVVLFYKRELDNKSGWTLAGQLKESLNLALSEDPVLAARLRKREGGDGGGLEIKFSDSGVRLVQARTEVAMSEFLGKESGGEDGRLAYWVDVDDQNPQFSPLFYVQLTVFKEEGYSIGINCSLLIANPLTLTSFLKTWGQIHRKMFTDGHFSTASVFHLGRFNRTGKAQYQSNPTPLHSSPPHPHYKTILYTAAGDDSMEMLPLASLCIEQAAEKLACVEAPPAFSLFLSNVSGGLKVECCSKQEVGVQLRESMKDGVKKVLELEEHLGFCKDVVFEEGLLPDKASYHVESFDGQGLVVLVPKYYDRDGWSSATISATVPLTAKIKYSN